MGLDQYAFIKGKESSDIKDATEIAYWRKHNRLQGWMEALWVKKGNTDEFNCKRLYLVPEDIDALEKDIANRKLPMTEGFFFGRDSYDYDGEEGNYYEYEKDIAFVERAKEAFVNGDEVFYSCGW